MVKNLLKKMLSTKIRSNLKKRYEYAFYTTDRLIFGIKRKWRKLLQRNTCIEIDNPPRKIFILAIRRKEYVDQAIFNINSLHYYNKQYQVKIFLDQLCFRYFNSIKRKLDYPNNVSCEIVMEPETVPWQKIKIRIVFEAGRNGAVFVDADERWFCDPADLFPADFLMFLTRVNIFNHVPREAVLISDGLRVSKYLEYTHFNTGIVSIPTVMATKMFEDKVNQVYESIMNMDRLLKLNEAEDKYIRRFSEEIGFSIAAQECLSAEAIKILKETDVYGDKKIIQSFYYGCLNGVQ